MCSSRQREGQHNIDHNSSSDPSWLGVGFFLASIVQPVCRALVIRNSFRLVVSVANVAILARLCDLQAILYSFHKDVKPKRKVTRMACVLQRLIVVICAYLFWLKLLTVLLDF